VIEYIEEGFLLTRAGGSMEKRSIGVIIAGWFLIVIGLAQYIVLFYGKDWIGLNLFPCPSQLFLVWPFLLLLAGIGLLNLKDWVRRIFIVYLWINIIVMLVLAYAGFISGMYYYGHSLKQIIEGMLPLMIIFVFPSVIYLSFFTRSRVKKQFKKDLASNIGLTDQAMAMDKLRVSRLSIASVVFAFLFIPLISALAAIILGIIALYHTGLYKDKLKGRGFAITGIVLGLVHILFLLFLAFFLSNSGGVYLAIGNFYKNKGNYNQAYKYYSKIRPQVYTFKDSSIDLRGIELYNNLGFSLSDLNKPEEAIESYKKVLDLSDKLLGITHHGIGSAYMHSGKYEQALEELDKATKYYPELYDAYQNKAVTYRLMGRYADSVEACQVTINRFPGFSKAYCSQGWAYEKLGQYEKAAQAHLEAISLSPKWIFPRDRLEECLKNIKDENVRAEILKKLDLINKGRIKADPKLTFRG
jgi:tetratricopeptide (TPR) repeat protein